MGEIIYPQEWAERDNEFLRQRIADLSIEIVLLESERDRLRGLVEE